MDRLDDDSDKPATVLIVDDDPGARLLLGTALEMAGFRVATAADGAAAIAAFQAQPSDCIVLDVVMPGMNGFDTCIALRELIPSRPHGVVAEHDYTEKDWPDASPAQRHEMTHLRHFFRTQPDFVAYWVNELPSTAPWLARNLFRCPLLTWTVRTPEQRARAARYADQMIFEGFVPGT